VITTTALIGRLPYPRWFYELQTQTDMAGGGFGKLRVVPKLGALMSKFTNVFCT
jgi:hypothetical protein